MEIYGETGSIKATAQILDVTEETVERRLSVAVQEFENAKRYLKETAKYKYVLFKKETVHACMQKKKIKKSLSFLTLELMGARKGCVNLKRKDCEGSF